MSLSVHIRKKIRTGRHEVEMLDVSFESEGGILALLGKTGSGKSTLLRCIAGIEKPDEGSIVLNGRVLFDSLKKINVPARKRGVVLVAPSDRKQCCLKSRKTVEENIRLAGRRNNRAEKISSKERKLVVSGRTAELLREYHLDGIGGFYPGALSEAQRLHAMLACAAAREPELLLLDEPFRELDPYVKAELADELKEKLSGGSGTSRTGSHGNYISGKPFNALPGTAENPGMTGEGRGIFAPEVLFASADADEVYAVSSHIISLAGGKSELVQARADFFRNPGTLPAALLSGCRNISRCDQLDGFHAFSPEWGCVFVFPGEETRVLVQKGSDTSQIVDVKGRKDWEALPKGFCAIGIRAEDCLMKLPEGATEEDYYRFTVHVQKVEDTLTDWLVWFRNGNDVDSGKKNLLWQVPKAKIRREEIGTVKRLYVPVAKIMQLVKQEKLSGGR